MDTLTEQQSLARAEGMKHGVPEEFAIDCKAIALVDVAVAGVKHKAQAEIRLYDSRVRDKLRKVRAIIVKQDCLLPQFVPSATVAAGPVEPLKGSDNGNEATTSDTGSENPPQRSRTSKKGTAAKPRRAGSRGDDRI